MKVARGVLLASRYRVQKRMGRGTTGAVYRAHDMVLDQTVAIKVLRETMQARPAGAHRLRREIRLSRSIVHANVCRVHEYVEDGGRSFLVRDFVPGGDLRTLVRQRGPLEPELACHIALQVAHGLAAIHAAGLVHRHLTATNVLCDASHRVRIAGLRRARSIDAQPARMHRVSGPAEYMSPEEARGHAVDARSDLYSLGVLLFELITGKPPFCAATPVLTRLRHIHEPPPLAGPQAARVPMRLLPLLERALAKRPEERFASAEEMAVALSAAAAPAVPMDSSPVPWALAGVGGEPEGRLNVPLAAASALVIPAIVALVAAGAWITTRSGPDEPLPSPFAQASRPDVVVAAPSAAAAATPTRPVPPPVAAVPDVRGAPAMPVVPVRAVRHDGSRAAAAAPAGSMVLAGSDTQRVFEEPVTPDVAPVAAPDDTPGRLQIGVRPWAVVRIDGRAVGETPLAPLALSPGEHTARLEHPDYQPIVRTITVRAGETVRLQLDFDRDGVVR